MSYRLREFPINYSEYVKRSEINVASPSVSNLTRSQRKYTPSDGINNETLWGEHNAPSSTILRPFELKKSQVISLVSVASPPPVYALIAAIKIHVSVLIENENVKTHSLIVAAGGGEMIVKLLASR